MRCVLLSVAALLRPTLAARFVAPSLSGGSAFDIAGPGASPLSALEDSDWDHWSGSVASTPESLAEASFEDELPASENLAIQLRQSVVRIQSISASANWFAPFEPGQESRSIGSGFAVQLATKGSVGTASPEDPVFVTNAHVVRNAHTVKIQLPAVGQQAFAAFVPLIYEDFDLALVRLVEPQRFLEFLKEQNSSLTVLPVKEVPVSMGMEVEALGFPLGSSSLKLSRGVIAGTEQVDGRLCFQSTAPISPGSSGGPLFALAGSGGQLEVIGVNFAVSSNKHAQNANYVVPAVHIRQLLHEFQRRKQSYRPLSVGHSKLTLQGGTMPKPLEHGELRFAPIAALVEEANEALYRFSGGCKTGAFLAKVQRNSVLATAKPPVEARSFISAVNGVPLDSFGMGRTKGFLGDPLPFENLMALQERLEDSITLAICRKGKVTQHRVSMEWQPQYEPGIKAISEPHFHREALDYEVFGGVTVMQLSMNHVLALLKRGAPTVGRWLLPENALQKRLVVAHVEPGTYASRVLAAGMVLRSLNGRNVSTLADFRKAFEPPSGLWRLETELGGVLEQDFRQAMLSQLAQVTASPANAFMKTPAFAAAVRERIAAAQEHQVTGRPGKAPIQQLDLAQLIKEALARGAGVGQQVIVLAPGAALGNFTVARPAAGPSHPGSQAHSTTRRDGGLLSKVTSRRPSM